LPGSMYATPLLPAIGNLLRCDGPTTQGESCDDVLADARAPRIVHCAPQRTDTQIQGSAWAARDRRVVGHADEGLRWVHPPVASVTGGMAPASAGPFVFAEDYQPGGLVTVPVASFR